jgi:hypothetical protein
VDRKLIGIILLVVGVLALAYGGFTYTRKTHEAEIGPVDIAVQDRERVNVPVWAGVAFVLGGAALLLTRPQTR